MTTPINNLSFNPILNLNGFEENNTSFPSESVASTSPESFRLLPTPIQVAPFGLTFESALGPPRSRKWYELTQVNEVLQQWRFKTLDSLEKGVIPKEETYIELGPFTLPYNFNNSFGENHAHRLDQGAFKEENISSFLKFVSDMDPIDQSNFFKTLEAIFRKILPNYGLTNGQSYWKCIVDRYYIYRRFDKEQGEALLVNAISNHSHLIVYTLLSFFINHLIKKFSAPSSISESQILCRLLFLSWALINPQPKPLPVVSSSVQNASTSQTPPANSPSIEKLASPIDIAPEYGLTFTLGYPSLAGVNREWPLVPANIVNINNAYNEPLDIQDPLKFRSIFENEVLLKDLEKKLISVRNILPPIGRIMKEAMEGGWRVDVKKGPKNVLFATTLLFMFERDYREVTAGRPGPYSDILKPVRTDTTLMKLLLSSSTSFIRQNYRLRGEISPEQILERVYFLLGNFIHPESFVNRNNFPSLPPQPLPVVSSSVQNASTSQTP